MRKKRTLRWLFVGAVAVVGLGYLALATRVSPDVERYAYAIGLLREQFGGPTVFDVSPLDDPRTEIVASPNGYLLHGVMKSDHPDLATDTKSSPTGEIRFSMSVFVVRRYGGLMKVTWVERYHFEPVK